LCRHAGNSETGRERIIRPLRLFVLVQAAPARELLFTVQTRTAERFARKQESSMSQAIQVIPSVSQPATAGGSPSVGAESPETGQSFESALAGQLTGGEAPAGDSGATGSVAADTPPDAGASMAAVLAASGNPLPPPLPPAPVDLAALAAAGVTESLAGTSAAPPAALADDLKKDSASAPDAAVDALLAAAPLPTMPAAMMTTPAMASPGQPSVVSPSKEGGALPASIESGLNHPAVPTMATRSAAADAQTLAALSAEAAGAAGSAKSADVPPSLEMFRSVLKEISPTTTDVRPPLTSLLAASGPVPASSFAAPIVNNSGAPLASAAITVPFGQAGWGQAFGNQVVWAVNQGMPGAELHLSPPDLGPMSVRISMDQDQASMAFSSPHAVVREAIEAALPRLRDMLGNQGITLADVNVSQHGGADARRDPGEWRNGSTADNAGPAPGSSMSGAGLTRTRVGMLDVYV
jgi:flagellar hook-length control protein FliK